MSNVSASKAPASGESSPPATPAARPEIGAADRVTRANEQRARFKDLSPVHMPSDYSISLDAHRRGGTDTFLDRPPEGSKRQPMARFERTYTNIVDYIVRITHRIWEEKDIGYIYDTYSHDCAVWDDFGLQYGRDKIVADTIQMSNAFPNIRIVADEVIWAGDENIGFHTSHRTHIFGTNTGYSRHGAPTGRRVQFWCMANCVARDNEISHEHVVYDSVALLEQMGFDAVEAAKRVAAAGTESLLPPSFMASDAKRQKGQGKPPSTPIPARIDEDPAAFVRAVLHTIWNRRNLAAIPQVYSPNVLVQATAGRAYHGAGQLQSFVLSMLAMFPDLNFTIDDLYWMGNGAEGYLVAIRWSIVGSHTGYGRYGAPTGKEVHLWGITHWVVDKNMIQKEWFMFNEFGVLIQLHR